eukprot:1779042-Amphidinium_carterae.1
MESTLATDAWAEVPLPLRVLLEKQGWTGKSSSLFHLLAEESDLEEIVIMTNSEGGACTTELRRVLNSLRDVALDWHTKRKRKRSQAEIRDEIMLSHCCGQLGLIQ